MRAAFQVPCAACGEESRFVAEATASDDFEVFAVHYACHCPDRPSPEALRPDGEAALNGALDSARWAALAGRSEDL